MNTKKFGDWLQELNFDVFSGVPCSYLKYLINYAYSECTYVNSANEGDAVAVSAGASLAGKRPVVLLQNSGLGNLISPLTSMSHIFKIPFLGFVSLRGGPNDEPQHELMGTITKEMLDVTKTPIAILSKDLEEAKMQIMAARDFIDAKRIPFFFIVEKGTFDEFELSIDSTPKKREGSLKRYENNGFVKISRNDALEVISKHKGKAGVIASTGKTGRELFEIEDSKQHLYMVGSMGCAPAMGLGACKFSNKPIIVIDGDGAALMRLSVMPMVANENPNMLHILLDNEEHNSTGGQSTISSVMDWPVFMESIGYNTLVVHSKDQLKHAIDEWKISKQLTFIYLKINNKTKPNLGRPTVKPKEVGKRFQKYLIS